MRRSVFVLLVATLLSGISTVATSQETGPFSAGIILGEPTGLSGKVWIGSSSAVDLAVAWSFVDTGRFYLHADYLQFFDFGQPDMGRLLFYGGLGGKFYGGQDVEVGLRIPLGALYEIEQIPLEVFLELAPGISVFPETAIDAGGGIGVRYRFE